MIMVMAETKNTQVGIVKFCINCGEQFEVPQPEEGKGKVIVCGDDFTGCSTKFQVKKLPSVMNVEIKENPDEDS